jgi:mannose-1-phosphate guanylyltransferase/mannose-6-phosphate isomerase
MSKIHPIIMSGGSGTRLWPLSRALYPKQFLKLASDQTMLQDAAQRVNDSGRFAPPIVICAEEHRFIIAEQLRELDITPAAIILEPVPRSTSAVAALAALFLLEHSKETDPLFLLMPTDHAIGDVGAFHKACDNAALAALDGALVTFGVTPERPETGYGYIKPGDALGVGTVQRVATFIEKPDQKAAESYVKQGFYWNSGMFLFGARTAKDELARLQPDIVARVADSLKKAKGDLDFLRLDHDSFSKVPAISIDYGLMEKTTRAAVVPVSMKWNDIGSWLSMWALGAKDGDGNVQVGDCLAEDTKNSYLHSEGRLVVTLGLEKTLVAALDDVVLVASLDRAQDIRSVVDKLKAKKREEVKSARRVYRPWGWYESLGEGTRFQVKRIMVKPGGRLSLQMHHHRSEHWVCVSGSARVTKNRDEIFLYENESVYLPAGTEHRLENPGKVPLIVIEVQSGAYLGEDDIVRVEDTYGRK